MQKKKMFAMFLQEFDCYVLGDEMVWTDEAFLKRVRQSAERLLAEAGMPEVPNMIMLLNEVKQDTHHWFWGEIRKKGGIDWNKGEYFERLVGLLDVIAGHWLEMEDVAKWLAGRPHGSPFPLSQAEIDGQTEAEWVLKGCLNHMAEGRRFPKRLDSLMLEGEMETGYEGVYGIHRWNESTRDAYEECQEEFEGYRYFRLKSWGDTREEDVYFVFYIDEPALKKYLGVVCQWYMEGLPEAEEEILNLMHKYSI